MQVGRERGRGYIGKDGVVNHGFRLDHDVILFQTSHSLSLSYGSRYTMLRATLSPGGEDALHSKENAKSLPSFWRILFDILMFFKFIKCFF